MSRFIPRPSDGGPITIADPADLAAFLERNPDYKVLGKASNGDDWLERADDYSHHDYPTEKIGGGNPYRRCKLCGLSVPAINGRIEGHRKDCAYRRFKEQNPGRQYVEPSE